MPRPDRPGHFSFPLKSLAKYTVREATGATFCAGAIVGHEKKVLHWPHSFTYSFSPMPTNTLSLMQLASFGVNLVVDASTKSTLDLIQIVGSVGLKEGHITITKASSKSTIDLMTIAKVYPRCITYDFTE